MRPVPADENIFFPFDPTVNIAGVGLKGKLPEPEGCVEAAGVLKLAPKVKTPVGLLFVKLKFVVLLPNWKTEPELGAAPEPNAD